MAEAIANQPALAGPDNRGMVPGNPVRTNPIDVIAQSVAVRHIARLVGLAAAVAIGMVVVLWTSEPNYAPLYTNMSGQDTAQIADVLTTNDIDFKLDSGSGAVLVDQSKLAEARLKLAAQGLPEGGLSGLEMLQEDQGLGTSQFIQTARYNHALEAELVRSVESIRSVEKARVHLAIPKQSIFIRNRIKPSASVVVKLYSGRILNPGQVEAIVQMVASSIPMLDSSQVTVIDQFGRLLTEDEDAGMAQTTKQFEYARQLENSFADRIINLLQPIVGLGKVNAQVAAQLDFSAVESTREAFDPERSVIRSEQVSEEEVRSFTEAVGIPGALSNQPPAGGTTELQDEANPANENSFEQNQTPSNQNRSATRNFEVDRIISHTSNPVGTIQRLSVAVVIDDKVVVQDDGSTEKISYSDEEVARFVNLVKETIGFDENRGDSVSIINTSFLEIEQPVIEEIPWWQNLLNEGWFLNLLKQVLGALGLLIVYLIFGRPFLRSLNPNRIEASADGAASGAGNAYAGAPAVSQGYPGGAMTGGYDPGLPNYANDPNNQAAMIRHNDATYEQKIDMARNLVVEDPARVAKVMKHWVGQDNG
jgi:flagellar M-ring protein FliF